MVNTALEVRQTNPVAVDHKGIVTFTEQPLQPAGIVCDLGAGVITFKETGQYCVQWWVATETTLKKTIKFELQFSGKSIPGCSPIKTGQVSGFGIINVDEADTTLSLVNMSEYQVMFSRKTDVTAFVLVTPIYASPVRVYRANLSPVGSFIQAPLGNGLFYRLERTNATDCRLVFTPMNGTTTYDYRRFSSWDGSIAMEGSYLDGATLNSLTIIDGLVVNNSREIHWVVVRVQNPISLLWSTYEVRLFISGGISRVTIWVNVIEEEVSY